MKESLYNAILDSINKFNGADHSCITHLSKLYPSINHKTLGSIKSLHSQRKTMFNFWRAKRAGNDLVQTFKNNSCMTYSGMIRELATFCDIQPGIMAKVLLEQRCKQYRPGKERKVSGYLKDTTLINDPYLSEEVFMSLISDMAYGPISHTIQHEIGKKYEIILQEHLISNDIPFKNEEVLRNEGYDKTPDTLLLLPIAVDNRIVNWIESKALFADKKNHGQYCNCQYESYFNRFGSGMVIYWFGFLDELFSLKQSQTKFVLKDHFPKFVKMNPDH